jgi:hypothetical protein
MCHKVQREQKIMFRNKSTIKIRKKGKKKALFVPLHHTWIYILAAYTSTTIKDLVWEDFANFYHLIDLCEELKTYATQVYQDLIYFLQSWFCFKKDKGIPPMGP